VIARGSQNCTIRTVLARDIALSCAWIASSKDFLKVEKIVVRLRLLITLRIKSVILFIYFLILANMAPPSAKQLPPFPEPPSIDSIKALVTTLAPTLNGVWTVDLKKSDPMAEFIKLMGAPWAIVKIIQMSGEPSATRTFLLSEAGLEDTIESKGSLGNRKDKTQWEFKEFSRLNPMGMPPSPSLLWIDSEKRIVMLAHNVTKVLRITTTLQPVERSVDGKLETLVAILNVTDADGKEALTIKRVMTRVCA